MSKDPFYEEDAWPDPEMPDLVKEAAVIYVQGIDIDIGKREDSMVTLRFKVKAGDLYKLNEFNNNSMGYLLPAALIGKR